MNASKKKDSNSKIVTGVVVSNKMDKTAVVAIERLEQHALYKKRIRKTTKLSVHDPENSCNIGDIIAIRETRPISKCKSWALVEVLTKSKIVD
ncbi:MAG: 30S ribosomal protein S17 [Thiotrichales bacterium]|nr:MAG: 30S ribosomal protein S17 [Thiotrichales bacterium]